MLSLCYTHVIDRYYIFIIILITTNKYQFVDSGQVYSVYCQYSLYDLLHNSYLSAWGHPMEILSPRIANDFLKHKPLIAMKRLLKGLSLILHLLFFFHSCVYHYITHMNDEELAWVTIDMRENFVI